VVGERLTPAALGEPTEREGEVVLEVDGLRGPRLRGVSLRARAGEILGIAGLVGCGRSELIRMLAGAQSPDAGEIRLDARPYRPRGPADAIAAGVACVPQERRREGVVLPMSTTENLTLGRLGTFSRRGVLGATRERRAALQMVSEYGIKPPDLGRTVALLSGGNQQKVVVARAAGGTPRVLLLDEPTQGVDALAKQEIWNSVRRLAAEGVTIVLASTDTEEFVGLCDRVVVLNRGRQVATASGEDITEERLTVLCTQKERAA
jgi:ribose transport system ATP-binding protein